MYTEAWIFPDEPNNAWDNLLRLALCTAVYMHAICFNLIANTELFPVHGTLTFKIISPGLVGSNMYARVCTKESQASLVAPVAPTPRLPSSVELFPRFVSGTKEIVTDHPKLE